MKKSTKILWGLVLIAVGVVAALSALNIADITLFFDGWWTLFIIVPCVVGLFTERDLAGNIFGIVVGVLLLLCCQDVLSFSLLWKLAVPALIVFIGCKLLFGGLFAGKGAALMQKVRASGTPLRNGTAVFSGTKVNFAGQPFRGAELNAVFGGVDCDLRGADISGDCVINANAVFGGIDIFVPDNLQVRVASTALFGGVSEKRKTVAPPEAPTLYINATCLFGGVDVK